MLSLHQFHALRRLDLYASTSVDKVVVPSPPTRRRYQHVVFSDVDGIHASSRFVRPISVDYDVVLTLYLHHAQEDEELEDKDTQQGARGTSVVRRCRLSNPAVLTHCAATVSIYAAAMVAHWHALGNLNVSKKVPCVFI
ncbi:uncharacterized protein ARMOST_02921 [Armillaria ostoyae]|uniref:Uncharacterized protein n=1 Tax=Armillaria ostoyae TaxID=47428 RepID=A0A284QT87_ARMOS|nr:uncharacterized protein ARMOST_02921 [Armillaria ostoyae]